MISYFLKSRKLREFLAITGIVSALSGCGKKNPVDNEPEFPELPSVQEEIIADVGGTIETDGYKVEFPANSLSQDAVVTIGDPEQELHYLPYTNYEQASSAFNIDIGSASLIDTCYVYFPYLNYNADNPPLPVLFDSNGEAIDMIKPVKEGDYVKVKLFSGRRGNNWSLRLEDVINSVRGLRITRSENFDNNCEVAAIEIHGVGEDASDFNEESDPRPTMHEANLARYNGNVLTIEWPYFSPLAINGSMLKNAFQEMESEHGEFQCKFDVYTHSAGGLVFRYFNRDNDEIEINNVFFFGTPHNGTTLEATIYHILHPPTRDDLVGFDPFSSGVTDCLTGSYFLTELNTTTTEQVGGIYYSIIGACTDDNPLIEGRDDHLVSVSSANFSELPEHEAVRIGGSYTFNLTHGKLIENRSDLFETLEGLLEQEEPGVIYVDDDNLGFEDGSFSHPFNEIQEAIDMAEEGTEIRVFPGDYYGISIYYKSGLFLKGLGDPIDIYVGNVNTGNADDILIRGFKIRRVSISGDNTTIENCIVSRDTDFGGGVNLMGQNVSFTNNTIVWRNTSSCSWSPVNVRWESNITLCNNIIWSDPVGSVTVSYGYPGSPDDCSRFDYLDSKYNCYLPAHCTPFYHEVFENGNCTENVDSCGRGETDMIAIPGFVDYENCDYRLLPGSPCIDAGDPNILDSDGTRSDIGAYGGPHAYRRLIDYQKSFRSDQK